FVEQFLAKYKEKFPELADKIQNVITIDSVRIEFPDGWGLICASNTQPVLVMRFEALDQNSLITYKESFIEIIGRKK
ncbi:MAG: phosphomannomutase, partial [Actinobacteria bacterium]|nr:phosphomannomutase [Actinomycetota bacterium]